MTRYKSFGGMVDSPMTTTTPNPYHRAIRHMERNSNGMMDHPQTPPYSEPYSQSPQTYGPPPRQLPAARYSELPPRPRRTGMMERTPVGVNYTTPPSTPYTEPFLGGMGGVGGMMRGGNPYQFHQQQFHPLHGPGPMSQQQHQFQPQQNCRLISEHIKACPICSKIYKRDSNMLITIIVILLLFIVVLLTKLADK